MVPSLGDDEATVWRLILADRRVIVPLSQVRGRSGLDSATFDQAVGNLADEGLLDVSQWAEPLATLSPRAAFGLGLKISRAHRGSGPRSLVWVDSRAPERRPRVKPQELSLEASEEVGRTAEDRDPPAPEEVAEATEEVELKARSFEDRKRRTESQRDPDNLPRPSVVLAGVQPWPPIQGPGKACPVCSGRVLWPSVYCLWCDRWGLDHVLRDLIRGERRAVKPAKVAKFRAVGT